MGSIFRRMFGASEPARDDASDIRLKKQDIETQQQLCDMQITKISYELGQQNRWIEYWEYRCKLRKLECQRGGINIKTDLRINQFVKSLVFHKKAAEQLQKDIDYLHNLKLTMFGHQSKVALFELFGTMQNKLKLEFKKINSDSVNDAVDEYEDIDSDIKEIQSSVNNMLERVNNVYEDDIEQELNAFLSDDVTLLHTAPGVPKTQIRAEKPKTNPVDITASSSKVKKQVEAQLA